MKKGIPYHLINKKKWEINNLKKKNQKHGKGAEGVKDE
jgi:hypothetical protein